MPPRLTTQQVKDLFADYGYIVPNDFIYRNNKQCMNSKGQGRRKAPLPFHCQNATPDSSFCTFPSARNPRLHQALLPAVSPVILDEEYSLSLPAAPFRTVRRP